MRFLPWLLGAAGLITTPAARGETCAVPRPDLVTIIVDMDPARPGCQSRVRVEAAATVVSRIGVFVLDPQQTRSVRAMGYVGGIDRGLAFGHSPSNLHRGRVVALVATAHTPVNPGNVPWVIPDSILDPGFAGPEVQYLELGSTAPTIIPAAPSGPIFTVDVHLEDAQEGDVFTFHLLDFVSVWSQGEGGVFSTRDELSLDTGGDAVADQTVSLWGIDPDAPIPVPPATFGVDLVDGPIDGGPAVIEVVQSIAVAEESWSMVKARYPE